MSTIKVNKIENTNTTAGGVEVDSSGHVQVDGVQMPTAGVLSNRNLIINGAFQVWQRGTSFTANSAVTFGADRFAAYGASSAANAYTRSTDVPANQGFTYSGSFDNVDIRHAIELPGDALRGQFVNGSKWTLSFWVKASSSGTSSVNPSWSNGSSASQATNWGTAVNYTYSTTWERKELTFTVGNNPASGDFAILLYWGSVAGQKITGVQFEQGDKATPFEYRSYGDELTRCQRYYEIQRCIGWPRATDTIIIGSISYKAEKRSTPSTAVSKIAGGGGGTVTAFRSSKYALGIYQTGADNSVDTEYQVKADAEL